MSRCTFCYQPININREKISRKTTYKNGKPIKPKPKHSAGASDVKSVKKVMYGFLNKKLIILLLLLK